MKLGLPLLELDAIRHQRDWEPLPDADFARRVASFIDQDGWVVDGNYFSQVTEGVIWPAADTVIWVDIPKPVVMGQVVSRTFRRAVLRQELWNGNRERLRDTLSRDPERSIIGWAWISYAPLRDRYAAATHDSQWGHLRFLRLRSRREMHRFLDGVSGLAA
jgi:adenylate kinase family enzyme